MKKLLCSLFSCALLFNFSCSNMNNNTNPLLSPFTAPHGAAPFDRIKTDDFEPAITKAIELHESEIDAIARQTDAPTYENTIEAMELSGSTLSRITSIFFNLHFFGILKGIFSIFRSDKFKSVCECLISGKEASTPMFY